MTSLVLKIMAMVSMLSDHCQFLFGLSEIFTWFGRWAFPLYTFMVADAYIHLKDNPARMKKYLLFLFVLGVISEPGFDFLFFGSWFYPTMQNQILQFAVLVAALVVGDRIPSRIGRVLFWIIVIALNQFLRLSYLGCGAALLLFMKLYLERREKLSMKKKFLFCSLLMLFFIIGMDVVGLFYYSGGPTAALADPWYHYAVLRRYFFVLFLIPVLAMYNGRYGNIPKWFKLLYRYFYPAHIYLFAGISMVMGLH